MFGRLLARQFDEMWRVLGSPDQMLLEELGPGRGLFAQDVLDWSEQKFPDFFRALRYVLVEILGCATEANRSDARSSPRIGQGSGFSRSKIASRNQALFSPTSFSMPFQWKSSVHKVRCASTHAAVTVSRPGFQLLPKNSNSSIDIRSIRNRENASKLRFNRRRRSAQQPDSNADSWS